MIIPMAIFFCLSAGFLPSQERGRDFEVIFYDCTFTFGACMIAWAMIAKPYWLASAIMAYGCVISALIAGGKKNYDGIVISLLFMIFCIIHAIYCY